jgi:hypothetical protein
MPRAVARRLPNKTPVPAGPIRNLQVRPDVSCTLMVSARAAGAAGRRSMHGIIYIIGLIVVIMAILSLFGLR